MVGLYQFIDLKGTGVAAWLMFLDVLIKVVGVERAEQTTACLSLQAPNLLVVGITLSPCPAHIHKRILIGK